MCILQLLQRKLLRLLCPNFLNRAASERCASCQQIPERDPESINIRTCVDLLLARFIKLLRTSESRSSYEACLRPKSRILCSDNFRHAVIDYLDQ